MAYEASAVINAPATRVFEYVSDVTRHGEWAAHKLQVTQDTPGPVVVGAKYTTVGHQMGAKKDVVTVTEYAPNTRFGFESSGPAGHVRHWFALAEEGGATRVTKATEPVKLKGSAKMASVFFPLIIPRGNAKDLARIKAKVETGA